MLPSGNTLPTMEIQDVTNEIKFFKAINILISRGLFTQNILSGGRFVIDSLVALPQVKG